MSSLEPGVHPFFFWGLQFKHADVQCVPHSLRTCLATEEKKPEVEGGGESGSKINALHPDSSKI